MTINEIRKLSLAQQYGLLNKPAQNVVDSLIDILVAGQGKSINDDAECTTEAKRRTIEEIDRLLYEAIGRMMPEKRAVLLAWAKETFPELEAERGWEYD